MPRRWSQLSGPERVERYTRWSLHGALWLHASANLLVREVQPAGDDRAPFVLGGVAVTALAAAALGAALRDHPRAPPRLLVLALVVAGAAYVVLATASAWDDDAREAALRVAVAAVVLVVGLRSGRALGAALVVGGAALFAATGDLWPDVLGGLTLAGSFLIAGRASTWLLGIVTQLDDARDAQARLSVAEERLRFSRDVHDVLGRRLSAIAVQAELAATLAARGDERAADRMLEVRAVAHEALRETRAIARGYRPTDLAQELDGARALLNAAGVDVRLDVDGLPRGWHEAAGWVVRESVTNVLRHSHATAVAIAYADDRLRVDNDGALPPGTDDGAGLRGLRERLVPLGATLAAGPAGDGGWAVTAELPGRGPLSAR